MDRHTTLAEPGSRTPTGEGTGRAFGTFGELLQGVLPGAPLEFLVTFPIAAWSTATFRLAAGRTDVRVWPEHKGKSRRLARLALDALGARDAGGDLELTTDLPEGKGLASSSADLVATARAVADALGTAFTETDIESLLRHIEPSDGVMYDGITAFYQCEVRLCRRLGELPGLAVVGHDEGGQVDTIRHHRLVKPFDAADRDEYARLLAAIGDAVASADLPEVGRIATRSAELNAKVRPRRGFEELRRACADIGGYGLVLAHSGTMLGVLVRGDDPELAAKTQHIRAACTALDGSVSVYHGLPAGDAGTDGHRTGD